MYPGRIQEVYRSRPIKRTRLESRSERFSGFAATLRAAAGFEAPETVLPLLGLALRETVVVRKESLRHLLSLRGSSGAEIVVRGFSLLSECERAEALRDRGRLLSAVLSVLASPMEGGRAGVAAFASSLAPGEGWDLLLCLLDDPDEEARTAARRAVVSFSREYASGRRRFPPATASRLAASGGFPARRRTPGRLRTYLEAA
jgi:hypothetical protein